VSSNWLTEIWPWKKPEPAPEPPRTPEMIRAEFLAELQLLAEKEERWARIGAANKQPMLQAKGAWYGQADQNPAGRSAYAEKELQRRRCMDLMEQLAIAEKNFVPRSNV